MNDIQNKKYSDLVTRKCIGYSWVLSEDVKNIMTSLLMARDKVINGDKLVQSILNNDLKQSIVFCDYYVSRYLRELVFAKDNFHI